MNQVKQRVKQVFPTILQYLETCYEDLYCFFFWRQEMAETKLCNQLFLQQNALLILIIFFTNIN